MAFLIVQGQTTDPFQLKLRFSYSVFKKYRIFDSINAFSENLENADTKGVKRPLNLILLLLLMLSGNLLISRSFSLFESPSDCFTSLRISIKYDKLRFWSFQMGGKVKISY